MIGSKHIQKRYMLYLFLVLILAGCAKPVYIAAKCPAPTIPPEPHYPIADLKPDDGHAKVAKAYALTVHRQHGYIVELKKILEGYQNE